MQPSITTSPKVTVLPDFEGLEPLSLPAGQEHASAATDDVRVGIDPAAAIAVVQLNRPGKRNALTHAMISQLIALLGQLDQNDAVRAVVLMGTRKGAFSAGADISQLSQLTTNEAHERKFLSNLNGAFETFSKPLIAAVEGLALGGGFEVALAAMELILQRQTISGKELAERGLVNKAFKKDEDVVLEATKLAARIATYSRPVVRIAKQAVLTAENNHLDAGMVLEKQLYYMTFSLDDFKVGTQAFLEKEQPDFKHQ